MKPSSLIILIVLVLVAATFAYSYCEERRSNHPPVVRNTPRSFFGRRARWVALVCLIPAVLLWTWVFSGTRWVDEISLRDGRVLEVSRTAGKTAGISFSGTRDPDKFALEFTHPDLGETIRWKGEPGFNPLAIEVVNGEMYVVALATWTISGIDMRPYGCPDSPFIFFQWDRQQNEWRQIAGDRFPDRPISANLLIKSDGESRYTPDRIRLLNATALPKGFLTEGIPRTFTSWSYPGKWEYKYDLYKQHQCP